MSQSKGEKMEIYRVRKSWINIASQVGAFFVLENAIEVAKKSKCNVYNSSKNCVWSYYDDYKIKL